MIYIARGTNNDTTGSLYECVKALEEATERNAGASIVRAGTRSIKGDMVAYWCDDTNKVRPTVNASTFEREIIS